VASVRALKFEPLVGVACRGVGILELYAGGSQKGGGRRWGVANTQEFISRFEVVERGVIHALGCFLYLGHGDRVEGKGSPGDKGRLSPTGRRSARSGPQDWHFQGLNLDVVCGVRPMRGTSEQSVEGDTEHGGETGMPQQDGDVEFERGGDPVLLEPRQHSITTDKRDAPSTVTRGAWRNPLLLLPEEIRVEEDDVVEVRSSVERLGCKGPRYRICLQLLRGGKRIGDQVREYYTQKDVFPWTRNKAKDSSQTELFSHRSPMKPRPPT